MANDYDDEVVFISVTKRRKENRAFISFIERCIENLAGLIKIDFHVLMAIGTLE